MGHKSRFPVKLCSNPDPMCISPQPLFGNMERFTNGALACGFQTSPRSLAFPVAVGLLRGRQRQNPPRGSCCWSSPTQPPGDPAAVGREGGSGRGGTRGAGGVRTPRLSPWRHGARPLVAPAHLHCCLSRTAERGVSRCWGRKEN